MMDEKKQQQKIAGKKRQEEAAGSESRRDGSLETSSNAQLTKAEGEPRSDDEEMIDNDNG